MKFSLATILALSAAGAWAQTTTLAPTTVSISTALVTEYYEDCSSGSAQGGTVTETITSDYCPQCSSASSYASSVSAAAVSVSAAAVSPVYTTVYTTVYMQTCSTGYTSATYVYTTTCTGPCTSPPASVLPQGFAVTVTGTETITICTICEAASSAAAAAASTTTISAVTTSASIFGQGSTVAPITSTRIANATVSAQSVTPFTGSASTSSFGVTASVTFAIVVMIGALVL